MTNIPPSTMRALICNAFAPIESLSMASVPPPVPEPDEITLRVAAAGVNFYDTLIVQGRYQIKPPFPFSPGGEVAGVVYAVGQNVHHLHPGDRVCAFTSYGGYAEICRAKAIQTWKLPDTVSFETAAAGLVTYGTAWFALHDHARIRSGETVLVLGAAGGVGQAAIQIAKTAGAQVIAVASHPDKLVQCQAQGADILINYQTENLKETIRQVTHGRGVDIVVDVVGGRHTKAALRATAWRGRILIIGFATGEIPCIPTNLVLLKGCTLSGVLWDELMRQEPEEASRQVHTVLAGFAEGWLAPPITACYRLEEAMQALSSLATRQAGGKLIILPST